MSAGPEFREQLRFLLSKGRVREALALLNSQTPYRFTALFRFGGTGLDNLVLYDRDNAGAPRLATIPVGDSYCTYVRDLHDAFLVEDSLGDPRVEGHPKRREVRAYCGMPLYGAGGELFGTICHFDFEAVAAPGDALDMLAEVAACLDPRQAEETASGELSVRIEALRSMLALLAEVSPSEHEAVEAFEEYARPIRDGAARLAGTRQAQLDAHVNALLAELRATMRTARPAASPT